MTARSITGVLGAALCALTVVCAPAGAARPAAGGHYYGFEANEARPFSVLRVDAELRVTGDRRRLHRGSYVRLAGDCRGRRRDVGFRVRLGGVALNRRGRFTRAGARGRVRYRLYGRFVSTDYARVTYVLGRCKVSRIPVALYLDGKPPFSSCRRQRAETLASSPDGRVFERYRLESSGEFYPYAYGCLYGGAGGQVLLGRNYDEETIAHPIVVGKFAAFASVGCGIGACNSAIVSQPLDRSGPALRRPSVLGGGYLSSMVESLVLKQNGSLAWLVLRSAAVQGQEPAQVREVYAADAQGRRRLDSGPAVAAESLSLDPTTSLLSWDNGGVTRTAPLD